MARNRFAAKLLDACDEGLLEWEALARECVAYMSGDDCESVADALGLNDDDDAKDSNPPAPAPDSAPTVNADEIFLKVAEATELQRKMEQDLANEFPGLTQEERQGIVQQFQKPDDVKQAMQQGWHKTLARDRDYDRLKKRLEEQPRGRVHERTPVGSASSTPAGQSASSLAEEIKQLYGEFGEMTPKQQRRVEAMEGGF